MTEEAINQETSQEIEQTAELQLMLSRQDEELSALKQSVGELEQKLAGVTGELAQTVGGYRDMVLRFNPEITPELIAGENIKAIDDSLEKAKNLVGKVRKSVEKELARGRVPVGSPGRHPADTSSLSPREKIHFGIGGKS